MKLWYTKLELMEAKAEAQREVERMNADLPHFIEGDVKLRMAWRAEPGIGALTTYIPEAELVVNGEPVKRDLLDLLLLDLLHLQMKALLPKAMEDKTNDKE